LTAIFARPKLDAPMRAHSEIRQIAGNHFRRLTRAGVVTLALFCAASASFVAVSAENDQIVKGNTTFAFKLLQQLAKAQRGQNIFISPYSISSVLQILRNGAAGETRNELDQALGTGGMAETNLAKSYAEIAGALKGGTNLTLEIANSVWFAPNIQLRPEFEVLIRDFYGARVGPLDFTDPRATGVVNAWVSQNTHGKITQILRGPLSGQTGAVVANAVYFKGTWLSRFDPAKTRSRPFKIAPDKEKQIPMMENSGEFSYYGDRDLQIIRLPYLVRSVGMYILLPSTNSSAEKLIGDLNRATWSQNVVHRLTSEKGTIALPRFKLEYASELKSPLLSMGIRRAFSQQADFSSASSGKLSLDRVIHKALLEIDEEGTTAAAATVGVATLSIHEPKNPFSMIVDHPFLCAICDNQTGTILFLGIVQDPD
jgi:serpin B